MNRRSGYLIGSIVAAVFLCLTALPFIFMTIPNPQPKTVSAPGSAGNGFYVQDARGSFELFPRPSLPSEWPQDAFTTSADVTVFVRARQYDDLAAYGVYAFPDGKPLRVSKEMVSGKMLRLAPSALLPPGRYIVQVSRDDAYGGSDYFCLTVGR